MVRTFLHLSIIFFTALRYHYSFAQTTCSETVIVDYQEIVIDTNNNQKGEGLRYILKKDPKSLELLEKYQEGTRLKWYDAVAGTAGSGLILYGLMFNQSAERRKQLLVTGLALLTFNFFISQTLKIRNERYLDEAIDEYNQRNSPRIERPDRPVSSSPALPWDKNRGMTVSVNIPF